MRRALDGWMLARALASPVQGHHHHGPRYFNFLIYARRHVALRNLGLLTKTDWSVFVRFIAENAGRGYRRQQSESIEVALDME